MVTFSVIIPTFNRAYLIGDAIESVIKQTFSDWELLVVDDGSCDNTKEVITEFICRDARIKYLYKKNGGQNSALNYGLAYAQGIYVAFLDSDDVWLESKLERVFEKFQSDEKIDCVYHWTGRMADHGEIPTFECFLEGNIYREVLIQGFMSSQISLSCKREQLKKIGNYDEQFKCCQDDAMCFELAKNFKIGLIREVLSLVGETPGERVTDNSVAKAENYWKLIVKYGGDIINLCGNIEMFHKYTRAMIFYCRAKMWKRAYEIKKEAEKLVDDRQNILKINMLYFYEVTKSITGYTSFALWRNKRRRMRSRVVHG